MLVATRQARAVSRLLHIEPHWWFALSEFPDTSVTPDR